MLILLVSDWDKPVAIVPLVKVFRDRKFGPLAKRLTSIEFLGHALLSRQFRFFYDIVTKEPSKELTESVIDWLFANHKFDIIHLAYISEESRNFDFSAQELLYALTCSTIDINSWQSYEQYRRIVYSKSLRQNIRTAFNRAAKASLQIDRKAGPAKGKSWQDVWQVAEAKLDKNAFVRDGYRNFLETLCQTDQAQAALIYANDEPIAYRLFASFPQGIFQIDSYRNWKYRRLELGALLIDRAVQDSFEQKMDLHCSGLFSGLHTERFATRLIKGFKYVKAGNSILGNIVNYAVRFCHREELPFLKRKVYPLTPPQ